MKRRVFDPNEIPPVLVNAEDAMRDARQRLAQRVAAQEAADEPQPNDNFEQRLAAARAAVAPAEPFAYCFVPRQGRFAITAITEDDLAVPVSLRTTLKWPKL